VNHTAAQSVAAANASRAPAGAEVPEVATGLEHGVYLHIPFCSHRCDYCAFATWTDRDELMERYVSAVQVEIERAYDGGLAPATTIFVGGGTPSRLAPPLLAGLIASVRTLPGAEVTVECNPESTTRELLEALREVGVNRISLGVQSMRPHVLAGLGRRHIPGAVERAVSLVGEFDFSSFSVDLVYGGAGEQDADWLASIEGVLSLDPIPPHVSAYALTIEPGTPLARDRSRHPDDDVQADRYLVADAALAAAGLDWYEISNFARPGHACRHNQACWRQANYRGFGCGAHSHADGRRSWNIWSLERYVEAVERGEEPLGGAEVLTPERRALERLQLALRTADGVPANAIGDDPALDGLIERREGRAVLTVRGRLLANEVALRLELVHDRECDSLSSM
jgi:oxygen-independent coproporphyrinogen-3 oxidase